MSFPITNLRIRRGGSTSSHFEIAAISNQLRKRRLSNVQNSTEFIARHREWFVSKCERA